MKNNNEKQRPKRRKVRVENSIIAEWMTPERLELISGWARDGYTDKEIAEKMGISAVSLRKYRLKHSELDKAVQNGKEVVDYKVESALLKSALGVMTTEVKVIAEFKNGILTKTIKERTTREQPPNVLACQTWLFNRKRDKWKRNRDNELVEETDNSISITITRAGKTIEIEEANDEDNKDSNTLF